MTGSAMGPVVILDNYDSFAYNLYQLIGGLTGRAPLVVRNDRVTLADIAALAPSHIVISPGPGRPDDPAYFGVCLEVIRALGPTTPLLGVCLGHQGIAVAFGGRVARAPVVMHGKASEIAHQGDALFAGVPSPFLAMRYHSLIVAPDSLPDDLAVTCQAADAQIIMGLRHRVHPIVGVQFHPESVGTRAGAAIISNFLAMERPVAGGARSGSQEPDDQGRRGQGGAYDRDPEETAHAGAARQGA